MRALLFLVGLLVAGLAACQTSAPPSRKLQAYDVIRIAVFNQPQIQAEVPIGKEGWVTAPFLGSIKASGKTPNELETELAEQYDKKLRLRDPIVSVTVIKFRQIFASVGGFVARPGTYEIREGDTLMSLLNQGGGPIPDRADLRRATLKRANSNELVPIDLYAMMIRGDTSQNFVIEDGDQLTVPEETKNRVIVMGAVNSPGLYPYKEPMTLADAVAQAHGPIPRRAKMSKVVVTRERAGYPGQYTRILADYVRFNDKGDQTQNVVLMPGDMVYIPETNTPDFNYIGALANVAFVLDRFGAGIFGLRLFGR
jgi:polysaccharide export outer membrane protein